MRGPFPLGLPDEWGEGPGRDRQGVRVGFRLQPQCNRRNSSCSWDTIALAVGRPHAQYVGLRHDVRPFRPEAGRSCHCASIPAMSSAKTTYRPDEHLLVVYLRTALEVGLPTQLSRVVAAILAGSQVLSIVAVLMPNAPDVATFIAWVLLGTGLLAGSFFLVMRPVAEIMRQNRELRIEREEAASKCASVEGVHECTTRVYGFRRDRVDTTVELTSSGAAVSTQEVTVRSLTTVVDELRHFVSGGTTGGEPDDSFRVSTEVLECPVEHEVDDVKATPNGLTWAVRFRPELPRDVPVTYMNKIKAPSRTFLMNREEVVAKAVPYEWHSHEVSYPTEQLDITIIFPKGWSWTKKKLEVWCDAGGLRNSDEMHRVDQPVGGKTKDNRHCLKLSVQNPILGMRYVVMWEPKPPKAVRTRKTRPATVGVTPQ